VTVTISGEEVLSTCNARDLVADKPVLRLASSRHYAL
jgi:hypothetical protein